MDAIYENGMTPDAPPRDVGPMTLKQVLEASETYFRILRGLLCTQDDEARGRVLAKMDEVTGLLEAEVRRQLNEPRVTDDPRQGGPLTPAAPPRQAA
jgi:hypothetical protein